MPLAKYLAVEKARTVSRVDLDDLISAAYFGLSRAAKLYEPERGVPFGAFARKYINWAILDEMRRADPAGERDRAKIEKLRDAASAVQARTGRPANAAELAAASGMSPESVARLLQLDDMARISISFEEHFDGSEGRQAPSLIDSIVLPEFIVEQAEHRAMLLRAIAALPEAIQRVIRSVYLEERMVKDLAEEMQVSHAYVSKLRRTGLDLLREAIQAWEGGTPVDRSTKTKALFFDAVLGDARGATAAPVGTR